jgi:hypothetical protein
LFELSLQIIYTQYIFTPVVIATIPYLTARAAAVAAAAAQSTKLSTRSAWPHVSATLLLLTQIDWFHSNCFIYSIITTIIAASEEFRAYLCEVPNAAY